MSQKKKGFYLEDDNDDHETSMYFNNPGLPGSNMFGNRDMIGSNSPSHSFGPASQSYQHQSFSRGGIYNSSGNIQRSTPTGFLQPNPQSPNSRNLLEQVTQRPPFSQINPNFGLQTNQPPTIQSSKRATSFGQNYGQQQQTLYNNFAQSQFSRPISSQGDPNSVTSNPIDLSTSEFPALGRVIPQASFPPNRNYVGMIGTTGSVLAPSGVSRSVDPPTEFTMQPEEFPALPGSTTGQSKQLNASSGDGPKLLTAQDEKDLSRLAEIKNGKNTLPASDGRVQVPSGMVEDQFGMVGLLTFLRASERNPNALAVSPGVELTSLGIPNLSAQGPICSTFQSPFVGGSCRPQDIDVNVPIEYLTNIHIRERLAPIALSNYSDDILFYLFYNNPGDFIQLAASAELYNRDWRFHKEEQVWLSRAQGHEPSLKTTTFERGQYYIFDPTNWRKILKEFHLEYSKLEDTPRAPQGPQQVRQQQMRQMDAIAAHS